MRLSGKEPACRCRRRKRHGLDPWVRKIPWRRASQPTPAFLPGESQEPGGLQSTGLERVRHDWSNVTRMHVDRADGFTGKALIKLSLRTQWSGVGDTMGLDSTRGLNSLQEIF